MKTPLDRLIATLDGTAPIAGVDFETYYDKTCSIKTLGAWAYCQHEQWDCYLVAVSRRTKEGIRLPTYVGDPKLFPWLELKGYRLYSHNAGFDMTVYRREVELGHIPDIEPFIEGWDCTADFGAYHCNRRSLKDVVHFMFGRELSKDVRDEALGKRWPADFTQDQQNAMLTYGGSDSDECLNIAEVAQDKWPAKERLLSRLTRLQAMRGVQLDVPKLTLFLQACRNRLIDIAAELPWIEDGFAPTSPKAFAQFCRDAGVPPPPVKAHEGEEAFIKWEESVAFLTEHTVAEFVEMDDDNWTYYHRSFSKLPWVVTGKDGEGHRGDLTGIKAPWFGNESVARVTKAVADHRSINKVIKQLEMLNARKDANGIFRFGLKYAGAHTLRWSGDSGFNMQNILKADANDPEAFWIVQDAVGNIVSTGSAAYDADFNNYRTALGKSPMPSVFHHAGKTFTLLDLRSLLLPRKGNKFIIADSSQIEPRCLAFLTADREFIELVKQGYDIYEAHARTMHGFTGPKGHLKYLANVVKDQYAITLRKRSKAERLGLGYQAGQRGYQKAAALLAGLVLTAEEALAAVREYRAANPKVVAFWNRLQDGLSASVGRTFRCRLPSGRLMSYRGVATEKKLFINPETKKPEWKEQLTAETDGKRHGYYGGKLTENLTQATARDVFAEFVLMTWAEAYDEVCAAGKTGFEALVASLDKAPLFTVHDEQIAEAPESEAPAWQKTIERVMRSTPDYMGDTPFDCESVIAPHYLK